MSRALSLNWELDIDGNTIEPLSLGEIGEGDEGRVETADGGVKYKVRDQIFVVDEIELMILIKKDKRDYNILQEVCKSGITRDIYAIGRDASGESIITYALVNCDVAMGKKSAFDRASKTVDTKKYYLIPEYVEEIS